MSITRSDTVECLIFKELYYASLLGVTKIKLMKYACIREQNARRTKITNIKHSIVLGHAKSVLSTWLLKMATLSSSGDCIET